MSTDYMSLSSRRGAARRVKLQQRNADAATTSVRVAEVEIAAAL